MNQIEILENAISNVLLQVDEMERLDRVTKEKVKDLISGLYNVTGEMKEQRENTWDKLQEVLNTL